MSKKLLLYAFVLLCFTACTFHHTNKLLSLSEQQMSQHPDSALFLLQSMQTSDLRLPEQKARYALLLSMARDKNYIDETDDSTITIAYNYYKRHSNKRYRMLSYYYSGIVHQNAGERLLAAIEFDNALSLAKELGDNHNAGLACRHLGRIHRLNYNHVSSLDYYEKAASFFDECNESLSSDYARVSMAENLSREYEWDSALEIVNSIISDATPPSLLRNALWIKTESLLYGKKDYKGALNTIEQIPLLNHRSDSITYYSAKALICEYCGKSNDADKYLKLIDSLPITAIDSLTLLEKEASIYKLRNEYEKAYSCLRTATNIQNKQITELLGQSVTRAMEEYYRQSLATEKEHSRLIKIISALIILLSLTVISILIITIQKSRQARIQDMADIDALNDDLKRIQKTNAQFKKVSTAILQDRIQFMQNLSESYFSWTDDEVRKREKKKGIESREELISLFKRQLGALRSDPALLESIENVVNVSNDNVMNQLRSICGKKMKEADYILLALLFSGLSTKSIAFLLRQSETSIRTRKSRYKQYFETLEEPYASRFIQLLG